MLVAFAAAVTVLLTAAEQFESSGEEPQQLAGAGELRNCPPRGFRSSSLPWAGQTFRCRAARAALTESLSSRGWALHSVGLMAVQLVTALSLAVLYRLTLNLTSLPYSPDLRNPGSATFQRSSDRVQAALDSLLQPLDGHPHASVLHFRSH